MINLTELKRRWERGCATLPGEFEPDPVTGARIVFAIGPEDREPAMLKRRIRGVIGYGPGWTLRGAVIDKFLVYIIMTVVVTGFALIAIRSRMIICQLICGMCE